MYTHTRAREHTHTRPLQVETLQTARYAVQKHFWKLKLIKSRHTSQWLPFFPDRGSKPHTHCYHDFSIKPAQTPSASPTPTPPPVIQTQSHSGGINTRYHLSRHLGKRWKVRLPCYFTLSCYHPLSNFLRLFALQLLMSLGSGGGRNQARGAENSNFTEK